MDILKVELFNLILRNKEIKGQQDYEKEYNTNIECMKIIADLAGPVIVAQWKEELLKKGEVVNGN